MHFRWFQEGNTIFCFRFCKVIGTTAKQIFSLKRSLADQYIFFRQIFLYRYRNKAVCMSERRFTRKRNGSIIRFLIAGLTASCQKIKFTYTRQCSILQTQIWHRNIVASRWFSGKRIIRTIGKLIYLIFPWQRRCWNPLAFSQCPFHRFTLFRHKKAKLITFRKSRNSRFIRHNPGAIGRSIHRSL